MGREKVADKPRERKDEGDEMRDETERGESERVRDDIVESWSQSGT